MQLYNGITNINIIGNDLPPILEFKYNIYYVKENFLVDPITNISIVNTGDYLPPIVEVNYNHQPKIVVEENIFNGMVKNTSDISLNPRAPKYCSLQVLDYKTLLSEGNTLDFVIYNKTILEAIQMVVNAVSGYGFQLGNVNILNPNEIIGTYSTANKTAYDVLQYLADISGAKWFCRKIDSTHLAIDFYDPTLMVKGKDIEYTTEWACENNLVDLKFNYGTRDYRNKQIILSDEVQSDVQFEESIYTDGVSKEFNLLNNVGEINSIIVNGVQKTYATYEEKEIGIYADFYYKKGSNILVANKALEFGQVINVSYYPIIKGREVISNENEIDRLNSQLGVDGTITRYETRSDETDSNKLLAIAETYLRYKGEAEITLTLKTHNNDLYNIGQMVYFNAPIDELKKDYLVKSKDINIIATGDDMYDVFYTFTLSSSFNSERAINYFDNQRNKLAGNIEEGEYISRNIDINDTTLVIWDNPTVTEVTNISGDNTLNSILESPFID